MTSVPSRSTAVILALLAVGCGTPKGGGDSGVLRGTRALSQSCSVDNDCVAGLSCREDTVSWMGHKQCAADCVDTSECAAYGAKTHCVDAYNFCAAGCTTDAECPAETACITSSGWCLSTTSVACTGTPKDCSTIATEDCEVAPGCTPTTFCTGTQPACATASTEADCWTIATCDWDGTNCTGTVDACDSLDYLTCQSYSRCTYADHACQGTALGCEARQPGDCGRDGCVLIDRSGVAPVCGNGKIELGEECDGANVNGNSCPYGGDISCTSACKLDSSKCAPPPSCHDVACNADMECYQACNGQQACPQATRACEDCLSLYGYIVLDCQ